MNQLAVESIPLVFPLKDWMKAHKFDKTDTLIKKLLTHPDFPRLSAVTETFSKFKIEVLAGRSDEITDLPARSNILLQMIGNGLVNIKNIDDQKVSYIDVHGKHITQELEDFEFDWTGVFLLPEKPVTDHNHQPNSKLAGFSKKALYFIPTLVLWLLYPDKPHYLLPAFFVGSLGLYFTLDALYASKSSLYLSKKCHIGSTSKCNKALNSEYALISKHFNFSFIDLSTAYFCAVLLLLLLSHVLVDSWKMLAVLSVSILPFSIFVQHFKLKSWCYLCLRIIFAQLLLFLIAVHQYTEVLAIDIIEAAAAMAALVLATYSWCRYRNKVVACFENLNDLARMRRISMRWSTYNGLLQDSKKVTTLPFHNHPKNHLTFFFSLSCPRCETTLTEVLNYWQMQVIPDKINLSFIAENSNGSIHASEFNKKQSVMKSNEAKIRSLQAFLSQKNSLLESTSTFNQSTIDKAYTIWFADNDLKSYPQIIYNNRIVPVEYTTKEILSITSNNN